MTTNHFEHIGIAAADLRTRAACDAVLLRAAGQTLARAKVARSFWSRFIGLLGHKRLLPGEAMLFVPGGSIHTWGMRFAIDVVFLDADLHVLRVAANVRPWRGAWAPRHTRYVLELPAHAAGVRRGDQLTLESV